MHAEEGGRGNSTSSSSERSGVLILLLLLPPACFLCADKKERDPTFRKQPQDAAASECVVEQSHALLRGRVVLALSRVLTLTDATWFPSPATKKSWTTAQTRSS
jgi:hypothetical protein